MSKRNIYFSFLFSAIVAFSGVSDSCANPVTVCDSGCQYTDIQTAINNTPLGGTLEIIGNFTKPTNSGHYKIDKGMTVVGKSAVIDCAGSCAGFAIYNTNPSAPVTFTSEGSGFLIKNMNANGNSQNFNYRGSSASCPVSGRTSVGFNHGAAIVIDYNGDVVIEKLKFYTNKYTNGGGAGIAVAGCSDVKDVTIRYNHFDSNEAFSGFGPATHIISNNSNSKVVVHKNRFFENQTDSSGGALFAAQGAESGTASQNIDLDLTYNVFIRNTSSLSGSTHGAGVAIDGVRDIDIIGNYFLENQGANGVLAVGGSTGDILRIFGNTFDYNNTGPGSLIRTRKHFLAGTRNGDLTVDIANNILRFGTSSGYSNWKTIDVPTNTSDQPIITSSTNAVNTNWGVSKPTMTEIIASNECQPEYVDPVKGDYHLKLDSSVNPSCVFDSGSVDFIRFPKLPQHDTDGAFRGDGFITQASDIGADEISPCGQIYTSGPAGIHTLDGEPGMRLYTNQTYEIIVVGKYTPSVAGCFWVASSYAAIGVSAPTFYGTFNLTPFPQVFSQKVDLPVGSFHPGNGVATTTIAAGQPIPAQAYIQSLFYPAEVNSVTYSGGCFSYGVFRVEFQ